MRLRLIHIFAAFVSGWVIFLVTMIDTQSLCQFMTESVCNKQREATSASANVDKQREVANTSANVVEVKMRNQRRRFRERCGYVKSELKRWQANTSQQDSQVPVVLYYSSIAGEGVGTILMERVGLVLLGIMLGRPVLVVRIGLEKKFNWLTFYGSETLPGLRDLPVIPQNYVLTRHQCKVAMTRTNNLKLPLKCYQFSQGRFALTMDSDAMKNDGRTIPGVWSIFNDQKTGPSTRHWSNSSLSLKELFPPSDLAVIFLSYSHAVKYIGVDFMRGRARSEMTDSIPMLNNDVSPICMSRALNDRPAPAVVKIVANAMAGVPENALLVTLHIRLGDIMMNKENPDVVDIRKASDIKSRLSVQDIEHRLGCVRRAVEKLRKRMAPREVAVFVTSDTDAALEAARKTIPGEIVHLPGKVVHVQMVKGKSGVGVENHDAIKVAADFLALSLGDVMFALTYSGFSAMAATAGMVPFTRFEHLVCSDITEEEIAQLDRQHHNRPRLGRNQQS